MLIVMPDPRAPRAPWTCIGCGEAFGAETRPAGVAGLARGRVCQPCSDWATQWKPPAVVSPDPEVSSTPTPAAAEPVALTPRRSKPEAPQFTTAEDIVILHGEKTGQRMTEVAIKLCRPDAEVERRLDQLCPRPRSKANVAAALDKVRRERISGERA